MACTEGVQVPQARVETCLQYGAESQSIGMMDTEYKEGLSSQLYCNILVEA